MSQESTGSSNSPLWHYTEGPYGGCPTQAHGRLITGNCFYFRYRHGYARLRIYGNAPNPDHMEEFGEDVDSDLSGYMECAAVTQLVEKWVRGYLLKPMSPLTEPLALPLAPSLETWLKGTIVDVPDYPKPGIIFKDITTLLQDAAAFDFTIDVLAGKARCLKPDVIVGLESRGFIFGAPLARALKIGFVPIRKPGKLPRDVERQEYELEYGKDTIEIHKDAVKPGQRVIVIDDLLATGGTAEAAQKLLAKLGAEVVGVGFVIELSFLNGRQKLQPGADVFSILTY